MNNPCSFCGGEQHPIRECPIYQQAHKMDSAELIELLHQYDVELEHTDKFLMGHHHTHSRQTLNAKLKQLCSENNKN